MKRNQGIVGEDTKQVKIEKPMMEMIDCEVQKPIGQGPLSVKNGTVATGIAILPSGQPRVMMIVTHADGTSLNAVFAGAAEVAELASMLLDASAEAGRVAIEVEKETKQ